MPRPDEQPQWQPISRLPLIASHIDEWLINSEEQYATMLPARERPHSLDDYTVGRVIKVFTEQKNDLWLWETQIARWKKDDLTSAQRQEVERLGRQLAKVRETIDSILALAKELSEGTIEKILAKSDFEVGLEFLLGKRKL